MSDAPKGASAPEPAPKPARIHPLVQRLAEKPLLERARLLAQVENWDDGSPEIELSSTPITFNLVANFEPV